MICQMYTKILKIQIILTNIDNPNKKRKVLIVYDDMIADMINNKRLSDK